MTSGIGRQDELSDVEQSYDSRIVTSTAWWILELVTGTREPRGRRKEIDVVGDPPGMPPQCFGHLNLVSEDLEGEVGVGRGGDTGEAEAGDIGGDLGGLEGADLGAAGGGVHHGGQGARAVLVDLVEGHGDGAVVVPIERAAQVLEASQARDEREASLRVKLQAGQLTYDLHGLRSFVEGQK